MIDRAIAIKRTLAIRSRLRSSCARYWLRVRKTRFGLELARDFFLDRKYGGWCGGIIRPPYPQLDAAITQSTHYWQLMKLLREVPINQSDILVDVGCGKGRVINCWLHMEYRNRIIGVELNPAVADWTRERLKAYPNVNIITGSILDHTPSHASFFFLYNPFGQGVMEKFKGYLRETSRNRPDLRVLYYNCVHRSLFDNDPDWEVQNLTSRVVEEAILLRIRHSNPGPLSH
jgi:SAM-dependent methyltransferase